MTQSGQGEEPSARPAHEGVVLPSDGGAPLVPGSPTAAPPGGQAWGTPWGPEAQGGPAAGQSWPSPPDQQWTGGPGPSAPAAAPLPPETPQGAQPYAPQGGYGGQGTYGGTPLPPAVDEATRYIPPVAAAPAPGGAADATQYLPPVAPAAPAADEGATQYLPPVTPGSLPPEMPGGSYGGGPAAGTPQAPYGGPGAYGAPGGPAAQPPAGTYGGPGGAETPAETTTYLGRAQKPAAAGGQPAAGTPGGSDADATQYIPPVPAAGGDRQPPAEFAGLFRSDEGPAGATQQMPRVPAAQGGYAPQPSYDRPGGAYPGDGGRRAGRDDEGGGRRGGRTGSRVPVIAAVGIGLAVLGIGAGALMGSDGDDEGDDSKNVSASAPATGQSTSPSPSASASEDPAKAQAVELDKLLADSGNSRQSVIGAVGNVKACDNLGQAAQDLRAAAQQRNGLVTRLEALSVDQLPAHAELTTALTNAWKASASADDHYAAWADQVAGNRKKFCKGGQARATGQAQAGNQASGTATAEKNKAAGLWNVIAAKYGLTERQPTQL
ncbi:hypothetical protein [Streptomyces sp. NPDC093094]|uniref:hypothetical protein n=1 Tax=Streptomyces sp. NPDC093094 TaxID=3366026 RepID=UPI0038045C0E